MGLLRVLNLVRITTGRVEEVLAAVVLANLRTNFGESFFGKRDRVGTHICNESTFVQTLGRTHDLLCGQAQLATGFLLQGARHEWRLG